MKIAILGLGAMGSRMAANLIKKGYSLNVWNRTPSAAASIKELGAVVADSPAEAARNADIVMAMLRDDDASRRIWLDPKDGALAAMKKGGIAMDSSTLTVPWGRQLAAECEHRGIDFLDAPVSGSLPQAEAAQLIFLLGGRESVVEKVREVILCMGSQIHYMGPSGSGFAMKLLVNSMLGVQVAALAELSGLAEKLGIGRGRMAEVLASTPVLSPFGKVALNFMQQESMPTLFPIELVAKDMRYVLETGKAAKASLPVVERVSEIFHSAAQTELKSRNYSFIVKRYLSGEASGH